ncbi:MAG: dephospho-CoA kinase [Myxococcota bacterium]
MKTVGLTGGIACGKSTVAALLREEGVPVIDADQVSRDVVMPGQPALAEIVARFGPEILNEDGTLNRKALGARVMGEENTRHRTDLESITHPRIFEAMGRHMQRFAADGAEIAVVEAALMVETGSYRIYDALLVVQCLPDVQVRRLMDRQGITEEDAQKWIASQMPVAEKAALADVIIDNDGSLLDLAASTAEGWQNVRRHVGLDD